LRHDAPRLDEIAARLAEQLGRAIRPVMNWKGEAGLRAVTHLDEGDVMLLGDLALELGEANDDEALAEALAGLCDIYCNAAFALSHEVRASTVGVTHKAGRAVAAPAFARELTGLETFFSDPPEPLYTILGGELSGPKLSLAEEIARRSDNLLVAGAMCLPFLIARGFVPNDAEIADQLIAKADRMLKEAREDKRDITVPIDFTVADRETLARLQRGERFALGPPLENVRREELRPEHIICDIGNLTRWSWGDSAGQAKTIFWHGPLGVCELGPFTEGTRFVAARLAGGAWPGIHRVMVCGGSLSRSLRQMGIAIVPTGHVSTAGRATLHYFAGHPLPAVEALGQASVRRRKPFRVLIPLDGSAADRRACEVAAAMATPQSQIFLLHVRRGTDVELRTDFRYALSKVEEAEWRVESERIFAHANATLTARGLIAADQIAVQGKPAIITLLYAERIGAQLIVVTADAEGETLDAGYVIDHAPCAVLVAEGVAAV
jgi:phosphoglycerate kinase